MRSPLRTEKTTSSLLWRQYRDLLDIINIDMITGDEARDRNSEKSEDDEDNEDESGNRGEGNSDDALSDLESEIDPEHRTKTPVTDLHLQEEEKSDEMPKKYRTRDRMPLLQRCYDADFGL